MMPKSYKVIKVVPPDLLDELTEGLLTGQLTYKDAQKRCEERGIKISHVALWNYIQAIKHQAVKPIGIQRLEEQKVISPEQALEYLSSLLNTVSDKLNAYLKEAEQLPASEVLPKLLMATSQITELLTAIERIQSKLPKPVKSQAEILQDVIKALEEVDIPTEVLVKIRDKLLVKVMGFGSNTSH